MRKLMITGLVFLSGILNAQTFLHDFQTEIEFTSRGASNYTLEKLASGGYAMASISEDLTGNPTGRVLITTLDAGMVKEHAAEYIMPNLGFGVAYQPRDLIQNGDGDIVVCGELITEGGGRGGFIMLIKYDSRGGLSFGWSRLYRFNVTPGNTPVRSFDGIIQSEDGYVLIGQSQSIPVSGVLVGTDLSGSPVWSQDVFDTQHGNAATALNDIVPMSSNTFAVLGTTNGFPADDADIMIATFESNGTPMLQKVYEHFGEQDDEDYTYKEYAKGLVYDRDEHTITIAAMVEKKIHGECVAADYRRIFGLQVDADNLDANWAHEYSIPADLIIENEGVRAESITYDVNSRTFGITGWVNNLAFTKNGSDNGFVLRLDQFGISTDLRYFGTIEDERLSTIIPGSSAGSFIMAGTRTLAENQPWIVESYATILEECQQTRGYDYTWEVNVDRHDASIVTANTEAVDIRPGELSPLVKEHVICNRIIASRTQQNTSGFSASAMAKVYPTITDGIVTIESSDYQSYKVYDLSTGKALSTGDILSNNEKIDLSGFANGIYILVLDGQDADQMTVRLVKQ